MLVVFSPIFVADTKIIYGFNFVARLINCEINLDLNQFKNSVIASNNADQDTTFSITGTKLYVPVVTLLIQDNAKLREQLKSGFKRTIN